MGKIITDTNIWYKLGRNGELFEKVKEKNLCPNYVNLIELSNTGNIMEKEESIRCAIQKIFRYYSSISKY
jgi:hypothetical protein